MLSVPPLRRHTRFRADSSSAHQLSPHQEQIAEREQRKKLSPVLGEANDKGKERSPRKSQSVGTSPPDGCEPSCGL
jgi:phage I-like protein